MDGASPSAQVAAALHVAPSPIDGRGVFTVIDLPAGEVVHVAPVMLLTDDEHDRLAGSTLDGYLYDWHEGGAALALGLGSLFNHDHDPNCRYELVDQTHPCWPAIVYRTRRAVSAGAELTIDYAGGEGELWFDVAAG